MVSTMSVSLTQAKKLCGECGVKMEGYCEEHLTRAKAAELIKMLDGTPEKAEEVRKILIEDWKAVSVRKIGPTYEPEKVYAEAVAAADAAIKGDKDSGKEGYVGVHFADGRNLFARYLSKQVADDQATPLVRPKMKNGKGIFLPIRNCKSAATKAKWGKTFVEVVAKYGIACEVYDPVLS